MRTSLPLLAAAAMLLGACAGRAPRTAPDARGEAPAGAVVTGPDALDDAARTALFRARRDSARLRFTAADVRFMTGMIGHHAQAVAMSNLAPTNTDHPAIRTLAARIINAQRDEIAIMQAWLRDRGQPVPAVHIEGHRAMVHGAEGHAHHTDMPGMLTDAQLDTLAAARGPEFDRRFLTYMIAHHKGAVAMVTTLFATDGAGQDTEVFKFASDVQVDQRTEVARMERMLATMTAPGASR